MSRCVHLISKITAVRGVLALATGRDFDEFSMACLMRVNRCKYIFIFTIIMIFEQLILCISTQSLIYQIIRHVHPPRRDSAYHPFSGLGLSTSTEVHT
jgi:hypothetical protein